VRVPPDFVYIVERLGSFHRLLEPGTHFIAPFIDRVAARTSMAPQLAQLSDTAISLDNVPVTVYTQFRWQIVDAKQAAQATPDIAAFVIGVVRAQQREWIARHRADEPTLQLEADVQRSASETSASAGVRVVEVRVGN
jgi:regulator of protease activity HflC (stomatin/prohibitin superfamily)